MIFQSTLSHKYEEPKCFVLNGCGIVFKKIIVAQRVCHAESHTSARFDFQLLKSQRTRRMNRQRRTDLVATIFEIVWSVA